MRTLLELLFIIISLRYSFQNSIEVSGPGLYPQNIVMPARYFFVNITSFYGKYIPSLANDLAVEIAGKSVKNSHCRIWVNKLDRKDGTFIVRYKVYDTCLDMSISIYYKSKPINDSPFMIQGPVLPDQCDCPKSDFDIWLQEYGCTKKTYMQIDRDLKNYNNVDMKVLVKRIIAKYHKPESTSFCHYVVKDNQIHRNCYGKHVGFNMFSDNILLFLTRKVVLPDMELVINLGDWPLVLKSSELLPVFSWCGSDETVDIVMPTYDITESTLQNMGRVTLDILSVQGSVAKEWSEREARAVWRGRDSRQERLNLVDIARTYPDLFNVSLTNFFFFRDKEAQYGPKQPHISFFKFFDFKYQINVDGTVAAYRLPYLLAGGGLVLKQESPYYEHFYKQLSAWEHYVPVARDLSDLKDRVLWARDHDQEARTISENAQKFANENLLPQHIICYHAKLFSEWSKKIKSKVTLSAGMTYVRQDEFPCECPTKESPNHEEL